MSKTITIFKFEGLLEYTAKNVTDLLQVVNFIGLFQLDNNRPYA